MSRISQGILGAGKGKVGGVIMSSWKGIATIRSMPASVANPRTAAQTAQRTKFTLMVAVARLLLSSLINVYWDPFTKKMSGYNAWMKYNNDAFTDVGLANPALAQMSRGSLMGYLTLSATAIASGHSINVTWVDNSGTGDALATDTIHVCYYNETQDYWSFSTDGSTRSTEVHDVIDNNLALNDQLHVYCFLARPDLSKVSNSEYLSVVVAA